MVISTPNQHLALTEARNHRKLFERIAQDTEAIETILPTLTKIISQEHTKIMTFLDEQLVKAQESEAAVKRLMGKIELLHSAQISELARPLASFRLSLWVRIGQALGLCPKA